MPVASGPPQPKPIALRDLKPNPDVLATIEEVQQAIDHKTGTVLDLRSRDYFEGEKKADIVKQSGHIPTARCAPAEEFVSAQATLLLPDRLKKILSQNAGGVNGPAITYCNSGRSASVGYFVLRRLGVDNVAMFDGSMAEWTAKSGPVESKDPDPARE
jgi:thiosulfate/3-mercaptopyruvate sulfurtransferase